MLESCTDQLTKKGADMEVALKKTLEVSQEKMKLLK
jgi:hypothetical protein